MDNLAIAEAYYKAMGQKDMESMKRYLHPDVQFKSPITQTKGRDAFLGPLTRLTSFMNSLTIRAKVGSGDQVMLVYDIDFPAPIERSSAAALLIFQEGLIANIEIFFDARPFDQMGK